jgi:predicted DNA-binding ArsR family transcriptional regulator
MISEKLDHIEEKIDKVIENQYTFQLKVTKRIDRNTLILNIIIKISVVLFIAIVGVAVTL